MTRIPDLNIFLCVRACYYLCLRVKFMLCSWLVELYCKNDCCSCKYKNFMYFSYYYIILNIPRNENIADLTLRQYRQRSNILSSFYRVQILSHADVLSHSFCLTLAFLFLHSLSLFPTYSISSFSQFSFLLCPVLTHFFTTYFPLRPWYPTHQFRFLQ